METKINKEIMEDTMRELIDFIEENNLCDLNNLRWVTDDDCYIDSDRSPEMKELLQKVHDVLGE